MEDFVFTIEQCKHLTDLGLDMSDAKLAWRRQVMKWDGSEPRDYQKKWSIQRNEPVIISNFEHFEMIPTYTMEEAISKLPKLIKLSEPFDRGNASKIKFVNLSIDNGIIYESYDGYGIRYFYFDIENGIYLNPIYDALCWVLENNYTEYVKED